MEYDYVVELKKERKKSIDVISLLVVLLSIIAFLFVLIKGNTFFYIFIASLILLIAGLIRLYTRKNKSPLVQFAPLLFISGLTWLAMPFIPWVALPVLLLSMLEKPAKTPLNIGFSKQGITLNNLFRKKFDWSEFNNVLMKDGMLTLDFKTNHIIQKELVDDGAAVNEQEFNLYCRSRLSAVSAIATTL
jgi:energy-coupling factor transporter transmembrane protein EcfT